MLMLSCSWVFFVQMVCFRDIHKNKVGSRAIRATKYKTRWRENLLAQAHLSCESIQIEYLSQKMAQQVWNIKKHWKCNFWLNYLPTKSTRTTLQTYKVEERTFGTPRTFEFVAELWRAKRACEAPWVSKSTHPRKFGNHVTVHRPPARCPSVRTTGMPMFTLTLSSYFGSPGESWLHINVVINWQLSKQGIRWPVSPDRIAGSGVDPSRSSIFWSYPLTIYSFSNDRRLTFTFFKIHIKYVVFMSVSPRTITILISNWPQTQKSRWGRPFLTMVTCWSRSTSNFYALIG